MTFDELKTAYKAKDQRLKEIEIELTQVKLDRSNIAKDIQAVQPGPFDLDGKEVVAAMKGTYFLRPPFKPGGGGKKASSPNDKAAVEPEA